MRILNPLAMAFVVLSIFVAAAQAGEEGNSATPAQSTAATSKQPSPVTLAELKLILESKLDGDWEAGTYLKGFVDLGPNARGATNTLYLIFPWGGDAEGIARAKKVTENWNRPTEIVWASEDWVVIGDGMSAPKDAEVMAATKRLTDLLKGLVSKAPDADAAAPAKAAEPAISVELGFRKKPPVFAPTESIVVEARFVNRTDKPQVYRGGLGDKNIKSSCQIKLMAEGGKAWSARAAAADALANYNDISVPAHGQTLIGEWDLSKLVYSEGSRWNAGGKIPFADIARPGKYRVRWWDGVFQAGTPLRSGPVDFEISPIANVGAVPAAEAIQGIDEILIAAANRIRATIEEQRTSGKELERYRDKAMQRLRRRGAGESLDVLGAAGPSIDVDLKGKTIPELYDIAKDIETTAHGFYRQCRAIEFARIQGVSLKDASAVTRIVIPKHPALDKKPFDAIVSATDSDQDALRAEIEKVRVEVSTMAAAQRRMLDMAKATMGDDAPASPDAKPAPGAGSSLRWIDGKLLCATDHAFPEPKDWSDFVPQGVKDRPIE